MSAQELFSYTDGSQLIQTSARWFVLQPVWEANRTLDPMHALDLERTITDPTTIQGPFTMVTYPQEEAGPPVRRIVDGQHRQEVLRRYFSAHPTAPDFSVLIREYAIDGPEEAIAIFQQINHAKPMLYRGSSTERLHAMVTALRKQFVGERGSHIVGLIRPASNRPFLNTENLEAAIQLYGLHEREDLTPAAVVAHAIAMNDWFAADPSRTGARVTQNILDRAVAYRFFLGLDPKCQWLMGLRLPV